MRMKETYPDEDKPYRERSMFITFESAQDLEDLINAANRTLSAQGADRMMQLRNRLISLSKG
ncbi:unnamed protein product [marine sediment metagenome]|uniref:Uncharacterized protein n=1 Tax=marine sediment metagenome TaxID=412755 RepID=X0UYT8_9ZZZZ